MVDSILIRQEATQDYNKISELIKRALNDIKESDHTEHLLVNRIRTSDTYIPELSLVAETDDKRIVGHIMLSKIKITDKDMSYSALTVAPLSGLPECQRNGIGKILLQEAHKRASMLGYDIAVLLGHKEYYPRFGYKKASAFGIKFPFDTPDECCMVLELRDNALSKIHGMVQYPYIFFIN